MNRRSLFLLMLILSVPVIASAHTGVGVFSGFLSGFGHPITGFDHLLAMLAVGLWATSLGGRSVWAVPIVFIMFMAVGGFVGIAGFSVPFIEQGILFSVFALGFLIAAALKVTPVYSAIIVGFFALFHGNAHGSEVPLASGIMAYTAGFLVATSLLHSIGISLGLLFQNFGSHRLGRLAGCVILFCGAYLSVS